MKSTPLIKDSSLCSSLSLSYQISHIYISGFLPLWPLHEQATNLWQSKGACLYTKDYTNVDLFHLDFCNSLSNA